MKKLLKILFVLIIIVSFTSCKDKKDVVVFGETEWYEPWMWKEYEPVIMERYIEFDFNEEAKHWLQGKPLKFELRTIDDDPVKNIKLYVNDKYCADNIFVINVQDTEAKIGIEFEKTAKEGNHSYIIKYIPSGGESLKLDVISFESFGYNNSIQAKKKDVANPAKVATIWSVIGFVALCVLWLIVSRLIIWSSTSFSTIYIDYNDNMGPKRIRMNGKYELVCTNNPRKKDSFMAKIFKGSKQYEYNDFWSHDVIICDGARKKVRVQGLKDFTLVGENRRNERFEIINDRDEKVTIETT